MHFDYFAEILFSDVVRLKIPGLKIGVLAGQNVTIRKKSATVDSEIKSLYKFIHDKFLSSPPSSDAVVSSVRRMYRRIGWEPTRYRPSSEAMIRRILKNTGLYNINNLVDLGNIVSTRFHLPLGLYDHSKINGTITIDVGKSEEFYEGLSILKIHAAGKLILRDLSGIFGNPTADSRRTCIANDTKNILAIFFTPPEISDSYIKDTLSYMARLYKTECPKSSIHSVILTAQNPV